MHAKLTLKEDYATNPDVLLDTGDVCLCWKSIELVFNVGPFPGGGDALVVKTEDRIMVINSNDLIHDLTAYNITMAP